jgi:2',3'-cyclic-nucleotide 2'-phosphodiesterase (5'-nucleotidase family)
LRLAEKLPKGLVDVVVGGHTHAGVAHLANGTAVVEAYLSGKAFSRVDLRVDLGKHRVSNVRLFPPHPLCPEPDPAPCALPEYEGARVRPNLAVARALEQEIESADQRSKTSLGVRIDRPLAREHKTESPLGNLFADLMLEAHPRADVALANGGSLRAGLPAGVLSYGMLYEAMPFDNRLVSVKMRALSLENALSKHFENDRHGIIAIAGMRAVARCESGKLRVSLLRKDGSSVAPEQDLTIATSDYLATGGDELLDPQDYTEPFHIQLDAPILRDALAEGLKRRAPAVPPDELQIDAAHPRLVLPSTRPVHCPK